MKDTHYIIYIYASAFLLILGGLPAFSQSYLTANTLEEELVDSLVCDSLPELTFHEKLDSLLRSDIFETSTVGLEVYDLTADTLVYKYNERQTLRPASTMKLTTAITALDQLGGSYRFSTTLKSNGTFIQRTDSLGNPSHKVFVGNLILRGGMDPRFGNDDMRAFVESLQRQEVDSIFGIIDTDLSFKEKNLLGHGWCWDDKNPVLTPLLWERKDAFVDKFRSELRDAGIVVVPASSAPRDSLFQALLQEKGTSEKILSTRYHSIDQILLNMMKNSDNLYAECLFYQIAASTKNRFATAKQAASVVQKFVKKLGLSPDRYFFADGSGLSLYNYQSAELQVAMLRYAFRNSNIYAHLLPSLPVSGVDGTLKSRMTQEPLRGKVKAKTGSLDGVSSLAGYVFTESGSILAFSIINQGIRKSATARNFQDKVCAAMYGYK